MCVWLPVGGPATAGQTHGDPWDLWAPMVPLEGLLGGRSILAWMLKPGPRGLVQWELMEGKLSALQ